MEKFIPRAMPESAAQCITGELIDGFALYPDIFSPTEQQAIIENIETEDLPTNGYYDDRLALRYSLPIWANDIITKICDLHIVGVRPTKLLIIRYKPRGCVQPHKDSGCIGNEIAGISLGTSTHLTLKTEDRDPTQKEQFPPVSKDRILIRKEMKALLNPGSVYVMRDEARYDAAHATEPVEGVRYSITLRNDHAYRK